MIRALLPIVLSLSLAPITASAAFAPIERESAQRDGYTVIRDDKGIWWFQRPDGTRFYSLGINNISPEPYAPRPGTTYYNPVPSQFGGSVERWADSIITLLTDHGFNTIGAWSSAAIPTSAPREKLAASRPRPVASV